jgi:peroxiredoxin
MRSDITPGAVFPDFALPDHTGVVRTLSELQGPDPLVVLLSRGHYCPKEHQQHLDLAAFQSKVAVAYTQMVTISTDAHHELQEFRASVGAQWTFLSDPGRIVQQELGIQEYTDPEHDPMIPHTLVLEPGLGVHKIYNGYWYWGRPSTAELRADLREVTRRCRPDWDITAPGWREAWEAGDRERFYPYGRSHAEIFAGTGVGGLSSGSSGMNSAELPWQRRLRIYMRGGKYRNSPAISAVPRLRPGRCGLVGENSPAHPRI